MTNKTETTKREMFHRLAKVKKAVARIAGPQYRLAGLENAIESHLEALRQEIEGLYGDVRSAEAAHDALVVKYEALGQTADERFRDLQLAEEANTKLQEIIRITGDEMRAFQQAARTDREDTVRAVAQADALADQLSEAHRTIASQGNKINAQQNAIGDLYMRAIF